LYAFLFSPMSATCPAYLTILHLIILKYLVKNINYERLQYASILRSPITSSLLSANIFVVCMIECRMSYSGSDNVRNAAESKTRTLALKRPNNFLSRAEIK
jgi:hypothetical protein